MPQGHAHGCSFERAAGRGGEDAANESNASAHLRKRLGSMSAMVKHEDDVPVVISGNKARAGVTGTTYATFSRSDLRAVLSRSSSSASIFIMAS